MLIESEIISKEYLPLKSEVQKELQEINTAVLQSVGAVSTLVASILAGTLPELQIVGGMLGGVLSMSVTKNLLDKSVKNRRKKLNFLLKDIETLEKIYLKLLKGEALTEQESGIMNYMEIETKEQLDNALKEGINPIEFAGNVFFQSGSNLQLREK